MLAQLRQNASAGIATITNYFQRYEYASLPTSTAGVTSGDAPTKGNGLSRKQLKIAAGVGGGAAVLLLLLAVRHELLPRPRWMIRQPAGWGLTEEMGWKEHPTSTDLGDKGEGAYRLGFASGEAAWYTDTLTSFALSLPAAVSHPILASLRGHFADDEFVPNSMIDYKNIFQTDKTRNEDAERAITRWDEKNQNDGWKVRFFDDADAEAWMRDSFQGSEVEWAWEFMKRGVLRADFFRYMLPLIEGGVYTDVDTVPIKPIEEWGTHEIEYLNISLTDGPDWQERLHERPAVVVGVEIDVHKHQHWKDFGWSRPLGICQWTLSGAPNHPIFLDAVRRVVNATHVVADWEDERAKQVERLKAEGKMQEAEEAAQQSDSTAMGVMEWTGPGLFSDAVMAFLLARYNVRWHRLRHLDHPLRIGDVLILPITSFSPGGEPDFHSGGAHDLQGAVVHDFRGSWKDDGYR